MKIVILTNGSKMAKYFVNKLSEKIDISKVFIEIKKIKYSQKRLFLNKIFGTKFIDKIIEFKNKLFLEDIVKFDKFMENKKIEEYFSDFNEKSSKFFVPCEEIILEKEKSKLEKENIDILLLFGTSIIKDKIIKIPKLATLNFHSSLLPYYKGSKVELWQILNDDYKYCGATIHYVDTGVDTGNIIIQEPINVEEKDIFWDLRYKNILKGIALYPKAIELVKNGYKGKVQKKISQPVFKGKMITPEKYITMYRKKGYKV